MLKASLTAAALALAATAASAQPQTNRPGLAVVCVDVNGALRPPACRQLQASRLDASEDSCVCRTGQRKSGLVRVPG